MRRPDHTTAGQTLRAFLARLILLPFLALQFVAPGTMATAGPDGLRMVLCSGDTTITVVRTADGDVIPVDPGESHETIDAVCLWSVTSELAIVAVSAPIAASTAVHVGTPLLDDPGFAVSAIAGLPRVRAPPHVA